MDNSTIFTKTAKGVGEVAGKTKLLSRDFRKILKEVDGTASLDGLKEKLKNFPDDKLVNVLNELISGDYIREFIPPPSENSVFNWSSGANFEDELTMGDFLESEKKARRDAEAHAKAAQEKVQNEEQARHNAQEKARQDPVIEAKKVAEEKAQRESEALAKKKSEEKIRQEAEARTRKNSEEQARRVAEEQARRAAELKVQREADELAKQEAAKQKHLKEQARKEADEKSKHDALKAKKEQEEQARLKAEDQARKAAELKSQRDAQDQARRDAEIEFQRQAQIQAQKDAEDRARREAEAQAKKIAEEQALIRIQELARLQAEENAQREAEARARKELEDRARREAEEIARLAAEAQIKKEADEKARRDAEIRAREEAEEQARLDAEIEARRLAQIQAQKDAEDRARREAEAQARKIAEALQRAQELARLEAQEKAQREAEASARQEVEDQARREAEEIARLAAEAQTKKEAEEKARRDAVEEAEELVRREAEERNRLALEVQALKEAEEKVKRETEEQQQREEQLRKQAEQAARLEAAAQAEREALEKSRREAEAQAKQIEAEQALRNAELQAQKDAERDAEREAERKSELEKAESAKELAQKIAAEKNQAAQEKILRRQEAEEQKKAKRESKERAEALRKEQKTARATEKASHKSNEKRYNKRSFSLGKPIAAVLFLLIVAGFALIHLISFDDKMALIEQEASEQFHQPVKIASVRLGLVPRPHWRLDGVSIGKEGQIKVPEIKVIVDLGTLFKGEIAFKSIALATPTMNEEGLGWLLFGKSQKEDLKFGSITATNIKLVSSNINFPVMDAWAEMGEDGAWEKIVLDSSDKTFHMELRPKDDAVQIDLTADTYMVPFGSTLALDKFYAKAIANLNELTVTEFGGGLYDGIISGNAKLKWGATWSIKGDLVAKMIDAGKLAPSLLQSSKLEGSAKYALQARTSDKLLVAPGFHGNFSLNNGTLLGVDFMSILRSKNSGVSSSFTEVTGAFNYESGRIQLRNMRLGAGLVSVIGGADVDVNKNLNGNFVVNLKSPNIQMRSNLVLSGTLQQPSFHR